MRIIDSNGHPVTVKPFQTVQSAVNTGADAIVIKAAVTGKRHFVTDVTIVNKTAGEYPVCELTGDALGTPVKHDTLIPTDNGNSAGMGYISRTYKMAIEVASGTTVGFQLQSATGDCYAHVRGYVEV